VAASSMAQTTEEMPQPSIPSGYLNCDRIAFRKKCHDLICMYMNTQPPSIDTIASNKGKQSINVLPDNEALVQTFTIDNLVAEYKGGYTNLSIWVDSKAVAGQAIQAIVMYDWNGDGLWDRTELYPFHATNPDEGFERWTEIASAASTVGEGYSNMNNGKIRIQLWEALPVDGGESGPIYFRTDSVISGQMSYVLLPYNVKEWTGKSDCETVATNTRESLPDRPTNNESGDDSEDSSASIIFGFSFVLMGILSNLY
jgi:hypothetical protein